MTPIRIFTYSMVRGKRDFIPTIIMASNITKIRMEDDIIKIFLSDGSVELVHKDDSEPLGTPIRMDLGIPIT